jgi:hypothetical protein
MSEHYDRTMSDLHCRYCGTRQAMRTRTIFNPEAFVTLVERFAAEHKLCSRFRNPAQARAVVRWAREMRKLDAPPRFVRHSILDEILAQRRPGSWVRGASI